jgi:hypothetical protein
MVYTHRYTPANSGKTLTHVYLSLNWAKTLVQSSIRRGGSDKRVEYEWTHKTGPQRQIAVPNAKRLPRWRVFAGELLDAPIELPDICARFTSKKPAEGEKIFEK